MTFTEAIQVRLDDDLLRRLDAHAGAGRRSSVIRDAVAGYVDGLIAVLDQTGRLDEERFARLPGTGGSGETVRVLVDAVLVEKLDRVEAYARGLGHRRATRSCLVRNALLILLSVG